MSTVDGGLTALDVNGERLWSYTTQQPLFKSTLSYSEVSLLPLIAFISSVTRFPDFLAEIW